MSFAGTEYLLSLTSFPDFRLILWQWKTGEQITTIQTKMHELSQNITCSPNSPHFFAQVEEDSGKFLVYQIRVCSKMVKLVPLEINENKTTSLSWTAENNLLFSDEFCNVWLSTFEENAEKRKQILKSDSEKVFENKPLVLAYKNGVITVDDKSLITFYRKSLTEFWEPVWTIFATSHPVRGVVHSQRDEILFHGAKGEIFRVKISTENLPSIEMLYFDGMKFKIVCGIGKFTDYVAAVNEAGYLNIFKISTGELSAKMYLRNHGAVLCLISHPVLPIIITSSARGNCLFINAHEPSESHIIKCLHLCKENLDLAKFSQRGTLFCTGVSKSGDIFFIGKKWTHKRTAVLGLLKIGKQMTDFLIYEKTNKEFYVLVLLVTFLDAFAGDSIVVYGCEITGEITSQAVCLISLMNPFRSLHYGGRKNLDVVAAPYLSKQLHVMQIGENFQELTLIEAISSMHQLRDVQIHVKSDYVVTCGYDGLIIVRDRKNITKIKRIFMPHHRSVGGTKSALFFDDVVVSLGRNGDLIATKLRLRRKIPVRESEDDELDSPEIEIECLNFTLDFAETSEEEEETWTEKETIKKMKNERKETLAEGNTILEDFRELKDQVEVSDNLNEKDLPVSCFDLDVENQKSRLSEAEVETENLRENLEEQISNEDHIDSYLLEKSSKPEVVSSRTLTAFASSKEVKNFVLIAQDFLNESQEFPDFQKNDDEERVGEGKIEEEKMCLSGLTTHKWIKDENSQFVHQLEKPYDRYETVKQNERISRSRETKLKVHFNTLFEEMGNLKKQEIEVAKKRIERINHCVLELKEMFGNEKMPEEIESTTWDFSEVSEDFVILSEVELSKKNSAVGEEIVSSTESVSDNEGKNSDDSFYADALDKMMDGLLEVRWEDEIKKDVVKPQCLLTKKSSEFTDEEIKAVELYKSKVEALEKEREKYKTMLESEIAETKESLLKGMNLFDEKLADLRVTKMQIESAILQEKLMRHRTFALYRKKVEFEKEIRRLNDVELLFLEIENRRIKDIRRSCENFVKELRDRFKNLTGRQKLLTNQFRAKFSELKDSVTDDLFRHYKRRPKTRGLTCTSVVYLTELENCVMNGECSEILPQDCLDFLKAVDGLDDMPSKLRTQIDFTYWQTMCQLRRQAIQMEISIKICAVELAEAEQTLSFYQKLTFSSRDEISRVTKKSKDLTRSLALLINDPEIQLVLKMGQIEILIPEDPTYSENVVLIPVEEIRRLNEAILAAGDRKLACMRANLDCRKAISAKEWQHRCAKMTLQDLQEELSCIRKFKITKEVRDYLTRQTCEKSSEDEYEKLQRNSDAVCKVLERLLNTEITRLKKIMEEEGEWRKRNGELSGEIEACKLENEKYTALLQDESRERFKEFREKRLKTIREHGRLVRKIRKNYEELISLHARLEILKLRTFPILKFETT